MSEIMGKVEAVNKLLQDGEPHNISVDSYSGYTGYKPMAVVDALNSIFGIGQWGFSEISSEIVETDKGPMAVAHVEVWLAGVDFKPTSWGQSNVTRGALGDARKGAVTDALKKGLSYFSLGNRAYHGLLENHDEKSKPVIRPASRPAPRTDEPEPTVANGIKDVRTRLNTLYAEGRRKKLFDGTNDFAAYISRCLVVTVTQQDLVSCSVEDLAHVARLIASETEPAEAVA